MKATELKPGNAISLDGRLFVCTSAEHTKPGKGPAYVQAKLRDAAQGGITEKRFNSSDTLDATVLDRREVEYLYSDDSGAVFMDTETYDQTTVPTSVLGDALLYLAPNARTEMLFHEERPITLQLPAAVELTITDTTPQVKGATATNQLKDAVCETGLKTRVPPFIEVGERVRILTADASYQSRAKE